MSDPFEYLAGYINANSEDGFAREALFRIKEDLVKAKQDVRNEIGRTKLAVTISEGAEKRNGELETTNQALMDQLRSAECRKAKPILQIGSEYCRDGRMVKFIGVDGRVTDIEDIGPCDWCTKTAQLLEDK